ncbi:MULTISPECIES: helix-turn-helix domain containing protein [unclassified Mycobacterium]|uniref:helix-turn-helix domain containing protein n=1 Tax=unclassified Mycobacterium TaxID=2642494 RepID=UPI000992A33E|nr:MULTISPECIES: helix-turn-helix domain containing protein [unclassified Mycobacterium]
MSEVAVVDEHEVEVLESITLDEAERLAVEIRQLAAVARDGFEKLALAVGRAKTTNIHQVLGYRSWPEFIEAQFGGKIEVHGSARQEVMAFLAGEGMSVRSIAAITDSSKSTVSRILNEVSQNGTGESEGAQAVTEEKITYGRDDKEYRKPKPRKKPEPQLTEETPTEETETPRRKTQIPTAVRAITTTLNVTVGELVELTYDLRWPKAALRLTHDDAKALIDVAMNLTLVSAAITSLLDDEARSTEPIPSIEAEEIISAANAEPEVLQQEPDSEVTKPVRPTNCERCNVDLPVSATNPLCDDCDGAPLVLASNTQEPPAVVVHNEAISKRSHERRRFGARRASA